MILAFILNDNLFNLQKVINRELKKVRKWLEANRLALNVDKTNYVNLYFILQPIKLTVLLELNLAQNPLVGLIA